MCGRSKALRLVLILAFIFLGVVIFGGRWYVQSKGGSCPACRCDCLSRNLLPMSLDCQKHDPDLKKEMEKSIADLLSEELKSLQNVTQAHLEHNRELTRNAWKTSSQYQKEAEKCSAGVDVCERTREWVEAALIAERKLAALWEKRARELGWKKSRLRLPVT